AGECEGCVSLGASVVASAAAGRDCGGERGRWCGRRRGRERPLCGVRRVYAGAAAELPTRQHRAPARALHQRWW
ncbi:Protein of unknown function, partial [Gryllus bimaculatus]